MMLDIAENLEIENGYRYEISDVEVSRCSEDNHFDLSYSYSKREDKNCNFLLSNSCHRREMIRNAFHTHLRQFGVVLLP